MMTKAFFLGATGHIGGAVVDAILTQLQDVEITALVRDQNKAKRLQQAFPQTRPVVGDMQDVDLIEKESEAAGIVINTSPDNLSDSHAAIRAVLRGLASCSEKGFYVQTSGAFLVGEDTNGQRASEKVWSDIVDIERITTSPPLRYHFQSDQLVRDDSTNVNVAIVSPVVVYGLSKSTENQIPITVRDIVATARELSAGFTVSQGSNVLSYIHVNDLADIYVRLLADAVAGAGNSKQHLWGPQAYYFASDEELTFSEYMEALVKVLKTKGLLATEAIKQIGVDSDASELEVVNRTARAHACGANIRCRSQRAETLLGWKPKGQRVKDTLPSVIDVLRSRYS